MKFFTLIAAAMLTSVSASAAGSVNIPTNASNPFDLNTATIENNSSFSPNVKDNGDFLNLDYFGEGDVAVFAINNTLESAYKITFETATPQDISNADFELLDANNTSIYKHNAPIERTGESGGDWGNYVVNATLPETPVMATGHYTLRITMHEGSLWQTFTANIRNIAFTAVEGGGEQPGTGEVTDVQTVIMSWTDADATHVAYEGDTEHEDVEDANNHLAWPNGFNLQLVRNDKGYSSAQDIMVNGESQLTMKLSNGAGNLLIAPEGYVITNLTLYDYINYDRVKKGGEGRACYWQQVGDNTYTEETGTILGDYIDKEDFKENPDKVSFTIPNLKSVLFKNIGEQLCFVMEVTYGKVTESGIENVIARPVLEDGVMYNLQGIRVDESYRGIVIMNGKKYLKR